MAAWLQDNPQPTGDFRDYQHACRVMEAYNNAYRVEPFALLKTRTGKPIVESSFAFPFGTVGTTPIIYTGKIDVGIEDNNGTWSFDHKTTFQFGDTFDSQMQMDGGQLGYCWALGQFVGKKPSGYLIDAVRIRKPNLKKAEFGGAAAVDASDFKRIPFTVSEDALDDWRTDTLALIADMLRYHSLSYFPRHRWQCTNKFGKCDMFDVCSLPRQFREHALGSDMYEDNVWSPLRQPEIS
jgi:hypothetical protein